MDARKLSSILIVCVLMTALLTGLATVSTAAKTTTNVTNTTTGKNLANSTVQAGTKHIIFRDDDIAPWADLNTLKTVNQVFINKNVPASLAITAHPDTDTSYNNQNELLMDTSMLNYLLSIKTNPLFEFTTHGYTHATGGVGSALVSKGSTAWHPSADRLNGSSRLVGAQLVSDSEYTGRPYEDQYTSIKHGWDDIAGALGVTPTTFVPPWNDGDDNTVLAAHAVGHVVYSSGWYDPAINAGVSGIYCQGADFEIPWEDINWDSVMPGIISQTNDVLDNAQAGADVVILTHFWSYTEDTTSNTAIDSNKIAWLNTYINDLKNRGDVDFTTLSNQNAFPPTTATTKVTLTASNTNPAVGQSVTFTGTLSRWNPTQNKWVAPLAGKPVDIWHVEPDLYRTDDATKTTDTNGNFSFTTSWSTLSKRPYSAYFDGDSSNILSLSYPVNITTKQSTNLTAASTTTPSVNQTFTINGTLKAGTTPVAGATVQLQKNSGTWTNVAGKTNNTKSDGTYNITTSEPTNGTYQYRTIYAGSATYANATSNVVNVTIHPGAWGAWASLGGQILAGTSPAACSPTSGQTDWFVVGTNHQLYYTSNGGSSWTSLGGSLTSSPAAVSPSAGVIDVFARGTNGALYTRHYSGGVWGGWTTLGGQIPAGTSPAACSWGASREDVFVQGTNGALYQNTWNGSGWSGWTSLGGSITSSPAATSPTSGVMDVFARGTNGALYTKHYSGGVWGAWTSLGGQIPAGTSPAACSWGASREDVFVQGTNGALYQNTWTGTWSGWTSLGGVLTSSPAATSPTSGVIDVGVRGTNGALYEKVYTGG